MTDKEKKPLEKEKKPKERKPRLLTTNDPINPKTKRKMITTHELPAHLPNYHGGKK